MEFMYLVFTESVPLMEFMYLVFTRVSGESYRSDSGLRCCAFAASLVDDAGQDSASSEYS